MLMHMIKASIFIRFSRIIRISGLPGSINLKLQIRIKRIGSGLRGSAADYADWLRIMRIETGLF